jgi:hypothetical protein
MPCVAVRCYAVLLLDGACLVFDSLQRPNLSLHAAVVFFFFWNLIISPESDKAPLALMRPRNQSFGDECHYHLLGLVAPN